MSDANLAIARDGILDADGDRPSGAAGALRLPLGGTTQQINETDLYYSGIYVEDSGPTTQP